MGSASSAGRDKMGGMVAVAVHRVGRRARVDLLAARGAILGVGAYAIAMAYVEAAAVLYLRTIYGGIDPVGPRNTPFSPLPDFIAIEIGREAATFVMLGAVGYLAARTAKARIGAFAIALGVWDIFYYVFLWLFAGWPASLFAPDVLFLIPLPWWGPVIAPVLVAGLIAVAGAGAMARELGDRHGLPTPHRSDLVLVCVGMAVCLVAFMADSLVALPGGIDRAYYARPGAFPWPLYAVGFVAIAAGLTRITTRYP
jgi:hypothetical protein